MTTSVRHAIVTGGGTGIGAAIAQALAGAGHTVTIVGRRREPLALVAATHPLIDFQTCNVCDDGEVVDMVGRVTADHGAATILVANAGAARSQPFRSMTSADFSAMLDVNLMGTFALWRAGLAGMEKAGWGRMVAVASMAGLKGYPYVASYVAAKHGVVGLVRALGLELAKSGITVNAIAPGFVETPLLAESVATIVAKTGRSAADAVASLVAGNPQGRLIQPEEVASLAVWLCSAEAGSVNGQTIAISGGET